MPRTLARLSESDVRKADDSGSKFHDVLSAMQEAQVGTKGSDTEPDDPTCVQEDWTHLLLKTFEEDEQQSFAQVNRKRKVLTFAAFQDRLMIPKTLCLAELVRPNVKHMEILFKRTGLLSKLGNLQPSQSIELAEFPEKFLGFGLIVGREDVFS